MCYYNLLVSTSNIHYIYKISLSLHSVDARLLCITNILNKWLDAVAKFYVTKVVIF